MRKVVIEFVDKAQDITDQGNTVEGLLLIAGLHPFGLDEPQIMLHLGYDFKVWLLFALAKLRVVVQDIC